MSAHPRQPRSARAAVLAALSAVVVLLAACTSPTEGDDGESEDANPHETAAQALADAMASGDFSAAPMPPDQRRIAQADTDAALEQMDGLDREVEISWVSTPYEEEDGLAADAAMRWHWSMPGTEQTWSYPISVHLYATDSETWHATWSRDLLARELGSDGVFVVEQADADRGRILDGDGEILVAERPVFRIGIDKTFIDSDRWEDAALELAEELDFSDPQGYADRVLAYGPRAFVDAVVIPQDNPGGLDLDALREVEGVNFVPGVRIQGPTESFAQPVLGRVGEATAEIIEESDGQVQAGDILGLSGMQAQYEDLMRGTPALTISVAQGSDTGSGAEGEGADEGADDDASAGDQEPAEAERTEVFTFEAVDGVDLETTLDADLQVLAEEILSEVEPASALVAIRPSDGHVLAVASGPGSRGWSTATLGQYAPGSTFKMVTALAMLRTGMDLQDTVQCPEALTVDGYTFSNNPGYPEDATGEITLTEAIAHSCNTAFVGQHDTLSPADIAEAATALGLIGQDGAGFPLFTGSVPQDVGGTEHAAALIGQGQVLASPVGMALVAASLSHGQTVHPVLLRNLEELREAQSEDSDDGDSAAGQDGEDGQPEGDGDDGTDAPDVGGEGVPGDDGDGAEPDQEGTEAAPLTHEEAAVLRQAMRAVVVDGTTPMLADVEGSPVVAKSGTAEHADGTTRTWVIAIQGDLAVAAFVEDGEYGAATSGPLVQDFLNGVN